MGPSIESLAPSICRDHSSDPTWLPLEEVLSLNGGDLGHCGEDVRTVGGRTLHAVAMIDLPLTGFLVHIELGRKGGKSGFIGRGSDSGLD